MVGFFEVSEGVRSMGRLQVFIGAIVGVALVGFGIAYKDMTFVYAGIGLIVGEGIVKGVQKAGEK